MDHAVPTAPLYLYMNRTKHFHMEEYFLEGFTITQLIQIRRFYGNQKCIVVLRKSTNGPYVEPIKSVPHFHAMFP
jgi:hypothetical protein